MQPRGGAGWCCGVCKALLSSLVRGVGVSVVEQAWLQFSNVSGIMLCFGAHRRVTPCFSSVSFAAVQERMHLAM